MAAGEHQLEALVVNHGVCVQFSFWFWSWCVRGGGGFELSRLEGERALAADAIDRAVAGRDGEPGARVGRRALARPSLGGDGERLLGGLLGEVEVTEEADQRGEDPPPLVAEDLIEQRPAPSAVTGNGG